MSRARPLPNYLATRYRAWKATEFAENGTWYRRLAEDGQRPRAMVIACCDSRLHVTSMFGAETGEFFVHRNIANLVPPFETGGGRHGTSAAIEYAVTGLRVAHIIVLGHSRCGGVAACHDMCEGHAPELEAEASFIGRWMDILRPAHAALPKGSGDRGERVDMLARAGLIASLENLMTFPFVAKALATGDLSLHAAFFDIASGELSALDPESNRFLPLIPS